MSNPPPPAAADDAPPKAGGLAVASLVFSILGFFPLVCIGSLAGLILGIIALIKAKPGQPKGMAVAGTVLGGAGITLTPIILLMALLVPVLGKARQQAGNLIVSVNASSICRGAEAHADSNNRWYPGWTAQGDRRAGGASGLAHLLAEEACSPKQLVSPPNDYAAMDPIPKGERDLRNLDAWCRLNSALIFLPDFKATRADRDHARINCFVDPAKAVNPGKIPVVRGDCAAEFMAKAELDLALTAQYGADSDTLARKWRRKEALTQ